ncbi:hypothetical protein NUW54_g9156 [Trametes sanguinea]|uniref:Uncharacterized protein n=1 Tax=Trametes sanguinea TaxID=158606 RepID=A0ACC1PAG2_9APHY|nr:hypothetical protein NUW54_g9156 [Trametes sanguinea]
MCLQYYTVQPGDTCLGIEVVFSVRDEELRSWNPEIDENCANLQVGLSYCIFGPYVPYTPTITAPGTTTTITSGSMMSTTTSSSTSAAVPVPTNVASGTVTDGCTQYYTVQSGDTCTVIDTEFSISLSDFRAWNPEVNAQCTNIALGLAYCVSGPPPSSSPIAPGTITTDCSSYYTVQAGDTCQVIEDQYSISFDQIRQWNPEVDANCGNIQPGLGYCVAGPPAGTGTITPSQGCTAYYTVQQGDSCPVIESLFEISFSQLQAWNPEINADCSNIIAGVQYCVAGAPPGSTTTTSSAMAPTGSGTLTPGEGCKKYYTVMSGDNCSVIAQEFGITLAQFIQWNPEIDSQCTNLQLGVEPDFSEATRYLCCEQELLIAQLS